MILDIIQYGHNTLRQKAATITAEQLKDPQLVTLVQNMIETMNDAHGIGLAAPQINESLQLAVVDLGGEDEGNTVLELNDKAVSLESITPLVFINPQLEFFPKHKEKMQEGCLSIQNLQATVIRPTLIKMTYLDLEGNTHTLKCDGLLARAIQHEFDHLEGILFTDRVSSLNKPKVKKQLEALLKPKSFF